MLHLCSGWQSQKGGHGNRKSSATWTSNLQLQYIFSKSRWIKAQTGPSEEENKTYSGMRCHDWQRWNYCLKLIWTCSWTFTRHFSLSPSNHKVALSFTSPGFVRLRIPQHFIPNFSHITILEVWFNSRTRNASLLRLGNSLRVSYCSIYSDMNR